MGSFVICSSLGKEEKDDETETNTNRRAGGFSCGVAGDSGGFPDLDGCLGRYHRSRIFEGDGSCGFIAQARRANRED